ncbi:hypothetical protein ACFOX0_10130 [Micromonospora zhanjiangensis]|uniref:Uncharacterized protein n=1 Tax=Micromonospora zhanjiangensis TaxID=1522057 RepID=A0ABV8KK42_9ACTN
MSAAHVPLPPGGPPHAVAAGVDRWVTAEPVRDLVHAFGGRWPAGGTGALLHWLDEFTARHWDFRAGRERHEAAEPDLHPHVADRVLAAARALGMVHAARAPRRTYRHLLVLGGLAHACVRRAGYAAHLLRAGVEVTGEVAVLGSFRPLGPAERRTLADAGIHGCRTEVDALDQGVRTAFAPVTLVDQAGHTGADPHASWSVRSYRTADDTTVRVLAAPSGEPAVRRAHTADTQRFWAGRVTLSAADRVLMVTAPIYVPFQHCDALRTLALPYGCGIDTIGVDPTLDLGPLPEPTLTPGRYLQEVRSAVRAMRALHAELVDHHRSTRQRATGCEEPTRG